MHESAGKDATLQTGYDNDEVLHHGLGEHANLSFCDSAKLNGPNEHLGTSENEAIVSDSLKHEWIDRFVRCPNCST